MRLLTYVITSDAFDEYQYMAGSASNDAFDNLCKCILDLYSNVYLRNPTHENIQRLYQKHEELHVFPGMCGSMHWA